MVMPFLPTISQIEEYCVVGRELSDKQCETIFNYVVTKLNDYAKTISRSSSNSHILDVYVKKYKNDKNHVSINSVIIYDDKSTQTPQRVVSGLWFYAQNHQCAICIPPLSLRQYVLMMLNARKCEALMDKLFAFNVLNGRTVSQLLIEAELFNEVMHG